MKTIKNPNRNTTHLVLLAACCNYFICTCGVANGQTDNSATIKAFEQFPSSFKEKEISPDFLRRTEIFEDLGGEGDVSAAKIAREVKAHPDSAVAHIHQGDVALLDGDYDQSIREFSTAVKIAPKNARAHIGLGRVYIAAQRFNIGLAELAKAQQLGPEQTSMNALWEYAFYLREMKRYPEALAKYDELLKLKTLTGRKRAWALFHRAELYERSKRPQLAIADLIESIKIAPLTNVIALRAKTYAELRKYKESLADFQIAIKRKSVALDKDTSGGLRSTLANLYGERAKVYEAMGDRTLAEKDLLAAHATEKNTLEAVPFRTK